MGHIITAAVLSPFLQVCNEPPVLCCFLQGLITLSELRTEGGGGETVFPLLFLSSPSSSYHPLFLSLLPPCFCDASLALPPPLPLGFGGFCCKRELQDCAAAWPCHALRGCPNWQTCPSKPKTFGRFLANHCSSSRNWAMGNSGKCGWVRPAIRRLCGREEGEKELGRPRALGRGLGSAVMKDGEKSTSFSFSPGMAAFLSGWQSHEADELGRSCKMNCRKSSRQ